MFEDNNSIEGRIESGIQGGLLWVLISSASGWAWRNKYLIAVWFAVYSVFCMLTGRTEMRQQMIAFPKEKVSMADIQYHRDENSDMVSRVRFTIRNNGPVRIYDIYASCVFIRTVSGEPRSDSVDSGYAYGYLGPNLEGNIELELDHPVFKPESVKCSPHFEYEHIDMLKLPQYRSK